MVLPLFKVLSLVLRVFSKPLINYTKQVHLRKQVKASHPLLRRGFISLGNTFHRWETWINRKFMKIQTQFAFKPLNDQLAIQKGIQYFYQIVFYSIIIGLPLYEMIQSTLQAKAKSAALQQKLKKIEDQIVDLNKAKNFPNKNQALKKQEKNQKENDPQIKSVTNNQAAKEQKVSLRNIKKIRFMYLNNQIFTMNLSPSIQQYSSQILSQIQKEDKDGTKT